MSMETLSRLEFKRHELDDRRRELEMARRELIRETERNDEEAVEFLIDKKMTDCFRVDWAKIRRMTRRAERNQ